MKNCKYIGILVIFFGVFISAHVTWAAKNFKALEVYFTNKMLEIPENWPEPGNNKAMYEAFFQKNIPGYVEIIKKGLGYKEVPGDSLRNVLRIMRGIQDAIEKNNKPLFAQKDEEFKKLFLSLANASKLSWFNFVASSPIEDIGDIADYIASMKELQELNTKTYAPGKENPTYKAKSERIVQIGEKFSDMLKAIQIVDLLGVHIDDTFYHRQLNRLFSVYNRDNAILKEGVSFLKLGVASSELALLKRSLIDSWSGFKKEILSENSTIGIYFDAMDKLAELRETRYKIETSEPVYKDKSKRILEMGDQFTNILKKMRIDKIKNIDKNSWPIYVMQLDNLFSKYNPKNHILRQGKVSGEKLSDLDHSDSAKALLDRPWNDLDQAQIPNTPEHRAQEFFLTIKDKYKLGKKEPKEQLAAQIAEDKYIHSLAYCAVIEQCTDKIEAYLKSLEKGLAAAEVVRVAQVEEGTYNPLQMLIASIKKLKFNNSPAYFQLQRAIRALVKYDNSKDPAVAKLLDNDDVQIVLDAMLAGDATIAGEMKRALAKVNDKFLNVWCTNNKAAFLPTDKNIRKSGKIGLSVLCDAETTRRSEAAERAREQEIEGIKEGFRQKELAIQQRLEEEIEREREKNRQALAALERQQSELSEQKGEEIGKAELQLRLEKIKVAITEKRLKAEQDRLEQIAVQLQLKSRLAEMAKDKLNFRTYVAYYNDELRKNGEEAAAKNVRQIFSWEYSAADQKTIYCDNAFRQLREKTELGRILAYSKVRISDAISEDQIAFKLTPEVTVLKQLLTVCMDKKNYANKYYKTLAKIAQPERPLEELADVEKIAQELEQYEAKTKGSVWGEAMVELKGKKWITNSPAYSNYSRTKLSDRHWEGFKQAWTDPIEEAEEFVDITTLSPPGLDTTKGFGEFLKHSLQVLDKKDRAITVRILVGCNWSKVNAFDVRRLLEDYTAGLRNDSKLRVIFGYWQNLNPLTGNKLISWNHSKIVASDGKKMFTGGSNLYDAYLDPDNPTHDLSVTITGDLTMVGHNFAQTLWNYLGTSGWLTNAGEMCTFTTKSGQKIYDCKLYVPEGFQITQPSKIPIVNAEKVLAVGRLGDAGGKEGFVSDHAIAKMIGDAKISLFISQQATLQLFNQTTFNTAVVEGLVKAIVERGVDVYILSSSTDPKAVGFGLEGYTGRHNSEQTWAYLHDIALRLKGLKNSKGQDLDKESNKSLQIADAFFQHLHVLPTANALKEVPNHAKLVIADGRVAYVGSHNLYDDSHAEFGVILGLLASEELVTDYFSPLWHASMQLGKEVEQPVALKNYELGDYVYILRTPEDPENASPNQNWTLAEVVNNEKDIWVNLDFLREPGARAGSRVRKVTSPDAIIRAPGHGNSGRMNQLDVSKVEEELERMRQQGEAFGRSLLIQSK